MLHSMSMDHLTLMSILYYGKRSEQSMLVFPSSYYWNYFSKTFQLRFTLICICLLPTTYMQATVLIMLCEEMFCAFFTLKWVDKKIELLSVFVLLLLMVKLISAYVTFKVYNVVTCTCCFTFLLKTMLILLNYWIKQTKYSFLILIDKKIVTL